VPRGTSRRRPAAGGQNAGGEREGTSHFGMIAEGPKRTPGRRRVGERPDVSGYGAARQLAPRQDARVCTLFSSAAIAAGSDERKALSSCQGSFCRS